MAFSPMMRHYLETKENYKDCILLYRLGDFYEMFFDDAVTASSTLDLVLTGRDCGDGQRAPMCGVPFRAVDNYVAKLIGAGYKVAICEQLEDPKQSVGIVDRGVIRVITPGTVMESAILEDKQNNYIASIVCGNLQSGEISCAICDISTGEFYATEFFGATSPKDLSELLVTFRPSEILGNTSAIFLNSNLDCFKSEYVPKIEPYYDWAFDFKKAEQCIKQQYKVNSVEGFGLADHMLAVSCSGALLQYILDTQKRQLPHLMPIKLINRNNFMSIDIKTRRNLELTVTNKENKRKGSLLWLLDNTKTSMGGRMISGWLDK
ncbi:MAG: DNA mismatch repair protein MutS, partial [Clostridia bacterium]